MKSTIRKRFPRSSRGQSLVELALMLVVILTLLAGAVDFGSAFFTYISLRDAAQEGALYASMVPVIDTYPYNLYNVGDAYNLTNIIARVRQSSSQPINLAVTTGPKRVEVTPTFNGLPCSGNSITIRVTYYYQITMPFVGAILGTQTIPLTAEVTDTILMPICP